jgi:hypothetical protein
LGVVEVVLKILVSPPSGNLTCAERGTWLPGNYLCDDRKERKEGMKMKREDSMLFRNSEIWRKILGFVEPTVAALRILSTLVCPPLYINAST